MTHADIQFRDTVQEKDPGIVRNITESSGFFYPDEIDVAVELAVETVQKGSQSGYFFIFAESGGGSLGYTCFGPIPCTRESYDLYWIAVHNDFRGQGIGKILIRASEEKIAELGGKRVYIETSSREKYKPTQNFYLSCGYKIEARLKDFYAPGDDKLIYLKVL
jgi:ribosomal protein S18 acetylase RimI-like enzyme